MSHPYLCVPNIATSRELSTIDLICDAVREAGAELIDVHTDIDHDRTVLTIAGNAEALSGGMKRAAAATVQLVDIRSNAGVHPKKGSLDVAPFVGNDESELRAAAAFAQDLMHEVARMEVPCFLYGPPFGRELPIVRREAFTAIRPDAGPAVPHPTAGACCIGARGPLVAMNIELKAGGLDIAQRIAAAIRTSSGGLPHVRALAFHLPSRKIDQISMNLTSPSETTIPVVLAEVTRRARELGAELGRTEIVGAVPRDALGEVSWRQLGTDGPIKVIEDELARLDH